jgi:myo-inositol-1-phosphate synthase
MLERERLMSKKISKTRSVTSQMDYDIGADNVHIGPSDYVPWLHDRKWAYIRLEGRSFGDVPLNVELKLEVHDSPNSAGIVIDAVRCIKLALDRGIGGALEGPSSYFMKSPPVQYSDNEARRLVEEFIGAPKAAPNGRVRRTARTKLAARAARR